MKTLSILALQNKHVTQQIVCKKSASDTAIYLKGIISNDYGVGATQLRAAFEEAGGGDVSLHINSPGGDVFEGREMQAVIASYAGKVTAVIEGIAASAATFVALSCSKVQMLKGSRFMIHNGMTIAFGNKSDMKAVYDVLESFDNELAAEYAAKTKGDVAQMTAWMDAETWFTAEQALEAGFVDQINPNVQNVAAEWNLAAYAKAPQIQAAAIEEPLGPADTDFLQAMVPHHQSAVDMVKQAMPKAASGRVRDLMESILKGQAGEIELMETWLGEVSEGPSNEKKKMDMVDMSNHITPEHRERQLQRLRLANHATRQ